ncbi:MAG TPA: YceI family protein [Anaeromyxobacter sp.]|nr:YceI family protein [Anaeromyxobacter sp.]
METTNAQTTAAPRGAAVVYRIDPTHASAQFKVRHLMVANVRGELGEVSGEAHIDPSDLSRSSVEARVDTTALSTRNTDRDAHLKSADFLDVGNHPSLAFRSTAVRPLALDRLEVKGELTIRGLTRPVTLAVELTDEVRDPWGNAKRGATATARINRKDFGLTWNAAMEGGGLVVGELVEVTIEAELLRQA